MDRRLNTFVLLFLASMLMVHGYLFWSVRHSILEGYPDFTSFYGAGKMVLQGQSHSLYDAREQWKIQQMFAPRVRIRKAALPYLRPPFEALLFVPLALLSYPVAYGLWFLINLGVAIGVGFLIRRHVSFLSDYPAWLAVLLPLAFTPIFLAMMQGQDSIFLLLAYTLAYIALLRATEFKAGCFLGIGLFKPHLVVPFAVVALLRGRTKIALGLATVAFILVLISGGLLGWTGLIHYPGYLWFLEQHTGRGLVLPRDTPNLRGLVEGILSGVLPNWLVLCLIGLTSIGTLLWAAAGKRGSRSADLIFCQAVVATFLVSYHAFAYDLSMLLLPTLLALAHVHPSNRERTRLARLALVAPAILLFFGPIYAWLWLRFHAMNLLAIVLLLWMWGMSRGISELPQRGPVSETALP